jgi:hypothetical protein
MNQKTGDLSHFERGQIDGKCLTVASVTENVSSLCMKVKVKLFP